MMKTKMEIPYKYSELDLNMIDSGWEYRLDGDKKIITVIVPLDEEVYIDKTIDEVTNMLNQF